MKKIHIALIATGTLITSLLLFRYYRNLGVPKIKILPFTTYENNGLAVLNFEINGEKYDSLLSTDGAASPAGWNGDIKWSVVFDGIKKITINASDEKTKKTATIQTILPDGFSLIKTK
jgi:hypothetical protein